MAFGPRECDTKILRNPGFLHYRSGILTSDPEFEFRIKRIQDGRNPVRKDILTKKPMFLFEKEIYFHGILFIYLFLQVVKNTSMIPQALLYYKKLLNMTTNRPLKNMFKPLWKVFEIVH